MVLPSATDFATDIERKYAEALEFAMKHGEADDAEHVARELVLLLYNARECEVCHQWVKADRSHCTPADLSRAEYIREHGVKVVRRGRPFETETCHCGLQIGKTAYRLHLQIHNCEDRILDIERSAAMQIDKISAKKDQLIQKKTQRIKELQAEVDDLERKRA